MLDRYGNLVDSAVASQKVSLSLPVLSVSACVFSGLPTDRNHPNLVQFKTQWGVRVSGVCAQADASDTFGSKVNKIIDGWKCFTI